MWHRGQAVGPRAKQLALEPSGVVFALRPRSGAMDRTLLSDLLCYGAEIQQFTPNDASITLIAPILKMLRAAGPVCRLVVLPMPPVARDRVRPPVDRAAR
eukprot:4751213-Pyramimonas_sp.AAC.1